MARPSCCCGRMARCCCARGPPRACSAAWPRCRPATGAPITSCDGAVQDAPVSARWRRLPVPVRHVFTHFPLELTVLRRARRQPATPAPAGMRFTPLERLREEPLPSLMLKVLEAGLDGAQAAAISALISPRSASSSSSPPSRSTCQKVQPLQAGRPCASAPTLWIEPTAGPSTSVPSARMTALWRRFSSVDRLAGLDQPGLDQAEEGHARLAALGRRERKGLRRQRLDRGDALARRLGIDRSRARQPMKWRPSALATAPVVPVPKNGSSIDIAGVAGRQHHPRQQRLGLLRRMDLLALAVLQPLLAGAERQIPVRAHLQVVIAALQRLVMEGVFRALAARRPDQRLMRIGEATAAEIRHRIGLAPDDVVQHPEAEILQDRADAEDVVVAADDPERAVGLQHAAAGGQPGAGEGVIFGEGRELVPVVVDGIDEAVVGPAQIAAELEIIGRIGEDQIDAGRRQPLIAATQSPTST